MARCTASNTESRVKSPFWASEETRLSRRLLSAAERFAAVSAMTGTACVRGAEQQSPFFLGEHGLDDHRDVPCSRIGLQLLEQLQAVFPIEIEIEEDRRRL